MYINRAKRWLVVVALIGLLLAANAAPAALADRARALESECDPPLTPRLLPSGYGAVVLQGARLNVRTLPQATVLATIPNGTTFQVVDGPVGVIDAEDDCLAWWFIYIYDLAMYGWIAEGWGEYWVAPTSAAGAASGVVTSTGGGLSIDGTLMRTGDELVEWGAWNDATGYVVIGWTWTEPDGTMGCAVSENASVSRGEFCAFAEAEQ